MRHLRTLMTMLALVAALAILAPGAALAAGETGSAADPQPSPAAAPALAIAAAPGAVSAGDRVRLTVRIGVPGATVQLSRTRAGAAEPTVIGQLTASFDGAVAWRAEPRVTTTYRVDYAGDGVQWLPASAEVAVAVGPRVTLSAPARVYRGDRAALSVAVRPAHPGGTVTLQLWRDGTWADWREAALGDDSRARLPGAATPRGRGGSAR